MCCDPVDQRSPDKGSGVTLTGPCEGQSQVNESDSSVCPGSSGNLHDGQSIPAGSPSGSMSSRFQVNGDPITSRLSGDATRLHRALSRSELGASELGHTYTPERLPGR